MTINQYQVLGREPVLFRGRHRLVRQLTQQIIKPTPDHMQVVGSKFIGKTVLLQHMVKLFQSGLKPYITSLYWNLGHQTPQSDAEFLNCFAKQIKSALTPFVPDIANELDPKYGELGEILFTVVEMLEDEEQQLLVVLDGFDKVMGMTSITRNLWDNLRTLADKRSLTFVTGSCRPLRELCKTEGSQTSDFWNIFNPTPLKVSIFDENDWKEMLTPFKNNEILIDSSGQKELINWSGGVPILAAALCNRLFAQIKSGTTVGKAQVDDVAVEVLEKYSIVLDELWDGCSLELQSGILELNKQDLPLSKISKQLCDLLEVRGYAKTSGSVLKCSCRLIQRYVDNVGNQVTDLRRLFGNTHDYQRNIRSLLELRLAQIQNANQNLQNLILRAIGDLNPEPTYALVWFRNIRDTSLDLIWDSELSGGQIPQHWIDQWRQDNELTLNTNNLPSNRGFQCEILCVMTNTRKGNTTRVACFVSKSTSLLMSHIHSVGNFGQHTDGYKVSIETAISFCLSAIELCENLAKELP